MAQDDRDQLRRRTPPEGVRAQTAKPVNESFEEETPIEGDPVTQINTRAKNAAASSKAAFGAIGDLRRELRAAVDRDVRDHQSMTTSIQGVNDKVDTIGEHVGNLREDVGEIRGTLHIMVNHLEADRRERAESAKLRAITDAEIKKAGAVAETEIKKVEAIAEIEVERAEKVAEIDESKSIAKHRRSRNLRILAGIISLITALSGILATQC